MITTLAGKYRPQTLDDVCDQQSIVKLLKKQFDMDKYSSCYLLTGPTGTGKTTLARIIAFNRNGSYDGMHEIDAAANNGVDYTRALVKEAYERSVVSKYKVYIIDEIHNLSNAAWQPYLKYLENPAPYTIMIMCTTDPQKVPATILNRVMRLNLHNISVESIRNRLNYICEAEHLIGYQDVTEYLSKTSRGGLRGAIADLEKCINYSDQLTLDNAVKALGNYSYSDFFKLLNAMIDGDVSTVLKTIDNFQNNGYDMRNLIDQYIRFALEVSKYALFQDINATRLPNALLSDVKSVVNFENPEKYYAYLCDRLLETKNMLKNDTDAVTTVGVMFTRIARCA